LQVCRKILPYGKCAKQRKNSLNVIRKKKFDFMSSAAAQGVVIYFATCLAQLAQKLKSDFIYDEREAVARQFIS